MTYFNEEIIYNPEVRNQDFYPSCMGTTFPDQDYIISRDNSTTIIIEYILEGSGYLEINDKTYLLIKGNCCIIPSHIKHKYYSNKIDPYKKKWINIKGDLAEYMLKFYYGNISPIISNCSIETELNTISKLLTTFNTSKEQIFFIYSKILLKIKENLIIKDNLTDRALTVPEEIRFYIKNHIQEEFSIDILSKKYLVSNCHIIRLFKKTFGITPYKYYINKKIELSKKLLINTNLSIEDICSRLNYYDRNHFSISFKKEVGLSPYEYRKSKKTS